MNFRKLRNNNIAIIALVIFAGAVVFSAIYYGYDTKIDKVRSCVATVTKYVTAEYSETTLDFEGELDTDYWSKHASDKFTVVTVNGNLSTTNGDFLPKLLGGVYHPPMPIKDDSLARYAYFDNFQNHTESKLIVYMEGDYFSEPVSNSNKCVGLIGKYILVKTWYGISYGSDY